MACSIETLRLALDQILISDNPSARGLKDYCPNGLQVQGKDRIETIVFGVTASLEFLEKAIAMKADAVVVHHGIVWNYQNRAITKDSVFHRRLKTAMESDLNLFAYHLPLDVHPEIGNNIAFAKAIEIFPQEAFGENDGILMCWAPRTSISLPELVSHIQGSRAVPKTDPALAPRVIAAPGDGRSIRKVAVCTGAAGSHFETAINEGADAFITGEISEQHWHIAKESGVAYIAAGHHFTESFGIQALMGRLEPHLSSSLGMPRMEFLNIHNPI